MQNELKPCPKCGGEVAIKVFYRKVLGMWKCCFYYAKCGTCGRRTYVSTDIYKAVEAWNRRCGDDSN